jgi:hypothetical protein
MSDDNQFIDRCVLHSFLSSDGRVTKHTDKNGKKHFDVSFFPDDIKMTEKYIESFFNVYGIRPKIYPKSLKTLGCLEVRCFLRDVFEDIVKFGIYGTYDWRIPNIVFDNTSALIEWVKCFFTAESYVSKCCKNIQLKSVNSVGLNDIKRGLDILGIESKIYGPYKQKKRNQSLYYMLVISRRNNILKYKKSIGFYHSKKNKNIDLIAEVV